MSAALLTAALTLAACTGQGAQDKALPSTPTAHDPPATFDAAKGVVLRRVVTDTQPAPLLLNGFDVLVAQTDGLHVIDSRSGEETSAPLPAGITVDAPASPGAAVGSAPAAVTGSPTGAVAAPSGVMSSSAAQSGAMPSGSTASVSGTASVTGTTSTTGSPTSTSTSTTAGAVPSVKLALAPAQQPIAATVGGSRVALAAFVGTVAGHGTTGGHDAVVVVRRPLEEPTNTPPDAAARQAVDAKATTWQLDLPIALDGTQDLYRATPVGVSGNLLVLSLLLSRDQTPTTYGFDLVSGRKKWSVPGFEATAVVGDRVIGVRPLGPGRQHVGALLAASGKASWSMAGNDLAAVTVYPAGAALVAVVGSATGFGPRTVSIMDAATGAVREAVAVPGDVRCWYDEKASTVCGQKPGAIGTSVWAGSFDATSGKVRWTLPDPRVGRVAPAVTTAWHGRIYATTGTGPICLDAVTGNDLTVAPGLAPDLVNAYIGLSEANLSNPLPRVYPAAS